MAWFVRPTTIVQKSAILRTNGTNAAAVLSSAKHWCAGRQYSTSSGEPEAFKQVQARRRPKLSKEQKEVIITYIKDNPSAKWTEVSKWAVEELHIDVTRTMIGELAIAKGLRRHIVKPPCSREMQKRIVDFLRDNAGMKRGDQIKWMEENLGVKLHTIQGIRQYAKEAAGLPIARKKATSEHVMRVVDFLKENRTLTRTEAIRRAEEKLDIKLPPTVASRYATKAGLPTLRHSTKRLSKQTAQQIVESLKQNSNLEWTEAIELVEEKFNFKMSPMQKYHYKKRAEFHIRKGLSEEEKEVGGRRRR